MESFQLSSFAILLNPQGAAIVGKAMTPADTLRFALARSEGKDKLRDRERYRSCVRSFVNATTMLREANCKINHRRSHASSPLVSSRTLSYASLTLFSGRFNGIDTVYRIDLLTAQQNSARLTTIR